LKGIEARFIAKKISWTRRLKDCMKALDSKTLEDPISRRFEDMRFWNDY